MSARHAGQAVPAAGHAASATAAQAIIVRGASFAYRVCGTGEPLVLVHANLSDMRSWDRLVPLLAGRFRVVAYSRRFAHPNRAAGDDARDDFIDHVDDLVALIDAWGLGPVHLVGNSSGAFIALLLAHRRPDLVRTLTLEEPPVVSMFLQALPPGPGEALRALLSAPAAFFALLRFGALSVGPAVAAFRNGDDRAAVDAFARGVLGTAAFAALSPARRGQMMDNAKAHRASLLGPGLPVFTAADAASMEVPTQLVRGSRTPGFQRRINQRLAARLPTARDVCVAGASHFVHEDRPHAVADAIIGFCGHHAT